MYLASGRYELTGLAGTGGMAEVWRAVQHGASGFRRPVAVKRILPDARTDELVTMFIEEARVCAKVQHPNVVQILDFGLDQQGEHFMVMEWVEGMDLRSYLSAHQQLGRRMPWSMAVAMVIEALKGLHAAHGRLNSGGEPAPVIHRDVTPQNILLSVDGITKLSDFGISRAMDRASWTSPQMVKGKLAYMAPEIFRDVDASAQSDLFSLGVVLWEALAGRRAYEGLHDGQFFVAASEATIPPLDDELDGLPPALVNAVERTLSKEPQDRFPSALAMRHTLDAILRGAPRPADEMALAASVVRARRVQSQSEGGVVRASATLTMGSGMLGEDEQGTRNKEQGIQNDGAAVDHASETVLIRRPPGDGDTTA